MTYKGHTSKRLDLDDPEVVSLLEKHAAAAKRFSDKFINARIYLPYRSTGPHPPRVLY